MCKGVKPLLIPKTSIPSKNVNDNDCMNLYFIRNENLSFLENCFNQCDYNKKQNHVLDKQDDFTNKKNYARIELLHVPQPISKGIKLGSNFDKEAEEDPLVNITYNVIGKNNVGNINQYNPRLSSNFEARCKIKNKRINQLMEEEKKFHSNLNIKCT